MRNKINVLFVTVLFVLAGCHTTIEVKHPNVIFILTDQWRGDALGNAGDPNVKTPHLDVFAKSPAQHQTGFMPEISIDRVAAFNLL